MQGTSYLCMRHDRVNQCGLKACPIFSTTKGPRPKNRVWSLLIAFGQEAAGSAENLIFKNFSLLGRDTRYAGGIKA